MGPKGRLRPAAGCLLGIALGLVLWALITTVAFLLLRRGWSRPPGPSSPRPPGPHHDL